MSKVYLVNNNFRNDYSTIPESLGSRVIITEGIVKQNASQLLELFSRAFENSTPEDYLVLSGPTLATSIALHCWLCRHGSGQVFVWDRARGYILHHITNE